MAIVKLTEKELEKIWSKEAEHYAGEAETSPDYLAHFQIIEEAIGSPAGKKIVDVGSGTAITSAYLAGKGADLTLVDISEKALNFSRKYFAGKGLRGKFLKQNAFSLDLPEKSFDVAWNGGVIEHFPDQDKILMMKKMWKLIRPGGLLLITAPNARDIPFMTAKQLLILRKKWAFGEEDDLTEPRMLRLAKMAGINNMTTFCYNPVVGWWFFPYGREITDLLGLNKPEFHKIKCGFGHNVVFSAVKE